MSELELNQNLTVPELLQSPTKSEKRKVGRPRLPEGTIGKNGQNREYMKKKSKEYSLKRRIKRLKENQYLIRKINASGHGGIKAKLENKLAEINEQIDMEKVIDG